MKSYEEMAHSVLRKAQAYKAKQTRRNRSVFVAATCLCCMALVIALVGKREKPQTDLPLDNSPTSKTNVFLDNNTTSTAGTTEAESDNKPRLVLLCAASQNDIPVVMREMIKLPYKAELRVRDISNASKEEKEQIIKEEDAYLDGLFGGNMAENGYARYSLDNALVTTIHLGTFEIKPENLDTIARIRATVTENGMLISYPRAKESHTSAYTFEDGAELVIDIDGEHLKQALVENERDTLLLHWNISPWAVTKLDKDPGMDLSAFSDRITITVDYTDGRAEIMTIQMLVDSNGQISAMLEGTEETT